MNKFLRLMIGAILTSLLLLSCVKKDANDAKVLKLSTVFVDDEQIAKSLKWVAKRVNERAAGSLEIQVFTGGQLPTGKDSLEQVVNGANWISVDGVSFLGDYVPDFNAVAGPMLYNSFDEFTAMTKTALVQELVKEAEAQGIKILALDYVFGFRSLLTDRVITTPADLKGLKIRVPNSKIYVNTLQAMGAAPSTLPFPEVYGAVQQGVIDGLEGSNLTIYGTKIYEVRKNVSLTRHILGVEAVSISLKVWNEELSEEQRTILSEEFEAGSVYNKAETIRLEEEYVQKLKDLGVAFNEVDQASFAEPVSHVFDQFAEWTPGIYDKIQLELTKIRGN